jgi:hypothetical protein
MTQRPLRVPVQLLLLLLLLLVSLLLHLWLVAQQLPLLLQLSRIPRQQKVQLL